MVTVRENISVMKLLEREEDSFCMATRFFNIKPKKIIRIVAIVILSAVVLPYLTLSPQWCLSKERVWKAKEIDMTLYVDDVYKTNIYQCLTLYNRDELEKYVKGKLIIDGKETWFGFEGEDHFPWVCMGNTSYMGFDERKKGLWSLQGNFRIVINPKRICYDIIENDGSIIPKSITHLTFVPYE